MKKGLATAAALAAVATASLGLAAPANASSVSAAPVKSASCWNSWAKAKESLKIRSKPTKSSTAIGLFPKGAKGCYDSGEAGQKYKACGKNGDQWATITYKGMEGYVMMTCIITKYS